MSKFSYSKEKFIGRQQLNENLSIISNSNKMPALLNASKTWQAISASSLKKRDSYKGHTRMN